MFDIKPNKPGPNTDIIMGIGAKKRPANSIYKHLLTDHPEPMQYWKIKVKWIAYLFIEINFANAWDMTNISPDAWRKYLLNTQSITFSVIKNLKIKIWYTLLGILLSKSS